MSGSLDRTEFFLQHDVRKALVDLGIRTDAFSVDVIITPVTTTDPEVITITYHSLYEASPYIKNTVKIEISGRSMMEPIEKKAINAAIDAHFSKAPFAEKPFEVNAVIPERTFLEKVFLLHEEFRKNEVRVERMSRHIYDLAMMMDSENKIADRYKEIADYKLIFTKLDETEAYGNIYNIKMYSGAPLSYMTNGQNVPDDIEEFNTQKIVKQLLGGR